MEVQALYAIVREISSGLSAKDPSYETLPENFDPSTSLNDLGLDITTLPEIILELENRLGGKDLKLDDILNPSDVNTMTIGDFLNQVHSSLLSAKKNPIVVYVDDEEENIFVFRRKYGKRLNLKYFTDSTEALEFIKENEDVSLVITDEVMPRLNGNQLCDEVHKSKPMMKFILMTGNPNNDGDLLYKTLRSNRFYDFISKPVDFEKNGEKYFDMIKQLIS